jgi:hypothetical protein
MSAKPQPVSLNCWAASLGDCGQKISKEHLVSQCLFDSDEIMVQGFQWCLTEPKSIGLTNFVAKILCKKHNNDLCELDSAALEAFNVFRESIRLNNVRGKIEKPSLWNVKYLAIDGPRLERWFLKTLINLGVVGKEWPPGAGYRGISAKDLVEIAFGLRRFENGGGMYIAARAGEQVDSMDRVQFTSMTEGKNLVAGRFNFRGYTFFLNLLPQKFTMLEQSHLLHQKAKLKCKVQNRLSHVIDINGW